MKKVFVCLSFTKMQLIWIVLTMLAAASCKQKSVVSDTQKIKSDTLQTGEEEKLPYKDSTIQQNGSRGYIDTFSIAGNHFRLVDEDSTYSGVVQKSVGNKWEDVFEVVLANHNAYSLKDVNLDGYLDFLHSWNWFDEVYFFDTVKQSFVDTVLANVEPEYTILDSSKRIFCDFHEGKRLCGHIGSTLYTFRGFKKFNLYDLKLYNCDSLKDDGKNADFITKFILSKCINGTSDSLKKVSEIVLKKPIDIYGDDYGIYPNGTDTYFDYVAYWKTKYKQLDLK